VVLAERLGVVLAERLGAVLADVLGVFEAVITDECPTAVVVATALGFIRVVETIKTEVD